ncbi:hypothetical protein C9F11_46505 (plasmid) [Streptomyces sp. YIM 121038]|nr:hypothetical protein C9F11_46505 [Streptomyces sp. YIM 121038]
MHHLELTRPQPDISKVSTHNHANDRTGHQSQQAPLQYYDNRRLRQWLRSRHITPRIARKGIESSERLGRHRWTIERTMSWPAGCRRLHRRYERKAIHFPAFASITCTLIRYRRLAK